MATDIDSKMLRVDGEPVLRVAEANEGEWFDGQLRGRDFLGTGRLVGDYLRQIAEVRDPPAALLVVAAGAGSIGVPATR